MSNRKWLFAVIPLFLLFGWLLVRFTLSFLHIHQLVRPLEAVEPIDGSPGKKIVLISQERGNYFWQAIEQGAHEAAAKYGLRLDYIGPDRINPSEQIKLLDKAISAKADAIVVQGINDPEYRALIDKAAGLGIPVVTVDTDEPGSKRLAYVGTDNEGAGRQMGELVAHAAGERGEIGVLISSEQVENQRLRLAGFRSVIGQYPGLHIVEIRSSNISRLQAVQQARQMLIQSPNIRYMVGFSALDGPGILEAAQRVGVSGLHIFAFDDMSETVTAIRQSKIESAIVQQPVEMGAQAIERLHDFFSGSTPTSVTYTRTYVMDKGSTGQNDGGETP
ncbi:substrate-binding domain-containing protein [Paenibacillus sp. HN-1]|uniref:substrate-binding domain-containing protein n=1 Tax=Paenibacillus TaxID=44249 RepID=UPI001CAA39F4|nr:MULTISPECIES: substrate-binding domain-containing protein [Paenibacillus]MBY9082353.1 substrate-binding domain-containing protein [Paenibacillus sp. CGMCC 1.18879]MBY9082890.1 substrate-binding domain-containing protein [Paenibacillus sinensis]